MYVVKHRGFAATVYVDQPHRDHPVPQEVCLVGVCGNIRRTQDGHLVHPNIDVDVLVAEEPPEHNTKPHQVYGIIERLVLGAYRDCVGWRQYMLVDTLHYLLSLPGRRRIELFGAQHNVRPGWVTVGAALQGSNFNPQLYAAHFVNHDGSVCVAHDGTKPLPGSASLVASLPEIEALRPVAGG